MPNFSDIERIDRAVASVSPDDPSHAEWYESYAHHHRARLAEDLAIIEDELPGGPSLEIGSVPPILTAALAESGRAVTGVDIAPERFYGAVEALGLDIRRCDIEREALPFEDASFDGVLFNEVFEHLRIDLNFTVSEIARVLRPGGRVMLSTPNVRSGRGIVSLLVLGRSAFLCPDIHREYGKLSTLGHMGHVREYTERDVTTLCAHAGLSHRKTIWRRPAKELLIERIVCSVVPQLRPVMTILLERSAIV